MKNSLQLAAAAALLALAAAAGGCNPEAPGSTITLGPVSYDKAFSTARTVLAHYFTLDEVDHEAGRITTLPDFIPPRGFSISDSAPDKQLAELTLYTDGQYVVARLAVPVRRRGSEAARMFGARDENYSGMPGQTPADLEGATTPKQNDVWQTYRYDHMLERRILRELDRLLRPAEQTPKGLTPVVPR
ncbi:MAG: hypothetical protein ISS78_10965 [Phycisphaerae bacterium]|nr:hypothetical protein [Phycisphaerae bacterium]